MTIKSVLKGMGYKCLSTIGSGTYSKVNLATSKKHGCNVAIKIVDKAAHPDFQRKFFPRELAILNKVHHDSIIKMHEVIEVGPRYTCIVMEAADKDLLQKMHECKRIPKTQAKTWFSQMVSAVHYLHQMDIVHRDLKCENILLTTDERVKISDFGFARFFKDCFESSCTFCGTAAYVPPEVLRNRPYDPKKFDVWSLGVILYTMVIGNLPYNDTSITRLPVLQEKPLVYPEDVDIDESWRAFLTTLLQVDPSIRPTIQQVSEHPWMQDS